MTDPEEIAKARQRREQYDRNSRWLRQQDLPSLYDQHRGQCLCVAGQELFIAKTSNEAYAMAMEAHPEDKGVVMRVVPEERLMRIYAV